MATGIPTSIKEIADKMVRIFGSGLRPVYKPKPNEDKIEITHSYADINRAREILHFVPKKRIDEGLKEMISPIHI
jgi:nucleoside-diphosphate-sugar epimerase